MDKITTLAGPGTMAALGLSQAFVGSHQKNEKQPGRLAFLRKEQSLADVTLNSIIQKKVWIHVNIFYKVL